MTGYAVRGHMGFVPKDGGFDRRMNVRFHSDELDLAETLKRPDECMADVIRLAFREWLRKECKKRGAVTHVRYVEDTPR